jgi:hypothetical protein
LLSFYIKPGKFFCGESDFYNSEKYGFSEPKLTGKKKYKKEN